MKRAILSWSCLSGWQYPDEFARWRPDPTQPCRKISEFLAHRSNKAGELPFGNTVGITRERLQSVAVAYGYLSPLRHNKAMALKNVERCRHTWTSHVEQSCQEIMRNGEPIASRTVVNHQYPSRQPFIDMVSGIGKGSVGRLDKQRLRVALRSFRIVRLSIRAANRCSFLIR